MSSTKFCRRSFMKALGISSIMLPVLDLELERTARGAPVGTAPRRFAAMMFPNGVTDNYWLGGSTRALTTANMPAAGGTAPLAPLTPFADDIIILDGISNQVMMKQFPSYGGHSGQCYMLTGANATGYTSGGQTGVVGNGASIDQALATDPTLPYSKSPVPSLVLGVDQASWTNPNGKYISFSGPSIGNVPSAPAVQDDVDALYLSLTAGAGLTAAQRAALLSERTSVLDYVNADLSRFRSRVGTADQAKIDAHLTSIRDIELQLKALSTANFNCAAPPKLQANNSLTYNLVVKAQIDLVVAAFASGLTSIATMLWSNMANNRWTFYWLGKQYQTKISGGFDSGTLDHHDLAHRAGHGTDPTYGPLKDGVDQWFISQFAYFVQQCKAVKEGNGTMLDNSVLLLFSNMGNGGSHTSQRIPMILAGQGGGYFKTGQYVQYGLDQQVAQNPVLVNILNAMGNPATTFGTAGFGGALPEVQA